MLQIDNVSHAYEDLVSLSSVTLHVAPGEIVFACLVQAAAARRPCCVASQAWSQPI